MKTWLLALFCMLTTVCFGIYIQSYTERSSIDLTNQVRQVEQQVLKHNWDDANSEFHYILSNWEKNRRIWALLVHHQEIDLVEQALIKSHQAILAKSFADAKMELGALYHFIGHIANRDKFSLTNIF